MNRWAWQDDNHTSVYEEPFSIPGNVTLQRPVDEEVDLDLVMAIHQRLIADVDPKKLAKLTDNQAREAVYSAAKTVSAEVAPQVVGESRDAVIDAVADEILGLGPIEKLIKNPMVSEVMVNAPDQVYWEEAGNIY